MYCWVSHLDEWVEINFIGKIQEKKAACTPTIAYLLVERAIILVYLLPSGSCWILLWVDVNSFALLTYPSSGQCDLLVKVLRQIMQMAEMQHSETLKSKHPMQYILMFSIFHNWLFCFHSKDWNHTMVFTYFFASQKVIIIFVSVSFR